MFIQMGVTVKLYDVPLCMFGESFINEMQSKFNKKNSLIIGEKYCCSVEGNYKKVNYDEAPDYNNSCRCCSMKSICTMVLKRYSVLAINNNVSYLDTE